MLQLELAPLSDDPVSPHTTSADMLLRRCSTPKLDASMVAAAEEMMPSSIPRQGLAEYAPPLSPVSAFGSYSAIPIPVLRNSSPKSLERPPPRESQSLPKIRVVNRDGSPAFLERIAKQNQDRIMQLQQQQEQQLQLQLNQAQLSSNQPMSVQSEPQVSSLQNVEVLKQVLQEPDSTTCSTEHLLTGVPSRDSDPMLSMTLTQKSADSLSAGAGEASEKSMNESLDASQLTKANDLASATAVGVNEQQSDDVDDGQSEREPGDLVLVVSDYDKLTASERTLQADSCKRVAKPRERRTQRRRHSVDDAHPREAGDDEGGDGDGRCVRVTRTKRQVLDQESQSKKVKLLT